jgi:site-specific DNA recombinase
MKTATKQAIGYIRVSSAQQAQEGVSLEAQQAKIEQWCSANGYELVNVFKDEGISGKRMDTRPGLQDALASVKKGNAFVFYSMSRVARSTKDMIEIGELIDKKRGDMVSLNGEPINTTTASGKMIFELFAVLAQFERNLVGERTASALRNKKSNNKKYCNKTPYGFKEVDGRLEQVKQEVKVVAEIQQARAKGQTLQSIADGLNSRGIPTKTNKKWQPATIHLLLQRTALVTQQ